MFREVLPSGLLYVGSTVMYSISIYLILTLQSVQLEPTYTNYRDSTKSDLSSAAPQTEGQYYWVGGGGSPAKCLFPHLAIHHPGGPSKEPHSISLPTHGAKTAVLAWNLTRSAGRVSANLATQSPQSHIIVQRQSLRVLLNSQQLQG